MIKQIIIFAYELIAQWYGFGFACLGSAVRALLRQDTIILTFFCPTLVLLIIWGSIPGQKWHFFRSLPQPWDLPFRIGFKKLYM